MKAGGTMRESDKSLTIRTAAKSCWLFYLPGFTMYEIPLGKVFIKD